MAIELVRFLGGVLVLVLPGIWLAGSLGVGQDRIEQWIYGSCIGLAGAIYLSIGTSQIDLRWFYGVWAAAALACLIARFRRGLGETTRQSVDPWIIVILLLVGLIRFSLALPRELPEGSLDPTFHMILAGKIQEAHHAIYDWRPFESISLNYPTGSHTLIVVVSAITGLPLHTVFKDLIAILGVLSTGIVYIFVRRAANENLLALWSAGAYGLWAWYGSNDYVRWGGLPNETAMLLLMTFLSLSMERLGQIAQIILMALIYSALIVTHHHTLIVSVLVIGTMFILGVTPRRILFLSVGAGILLDFFFVIPFAIKVTTIRSTMVLAESEPSLTAIQTIGGIGWMTASMGAIGLAIWYASRKPRFSATVFCAMGVLAAMFVLTEYFIPLTLKLLGRPAAMAFAPSRFLTDLNYFLAIFAGFFVWWLRARLRIGRMWVLAFICVASAVDYGKWTAVAFPTGNAMPPAGFVEACRWIHDHTSSSTVVLNRDNWTTYLTWRRTTFPPIPAPEPIPDHAPMMRRLADIMSGRVAPDSADMTMVQILPSQTKSDSRVLWEGDGYKVVQIWPKTAVDAS